MAEFIPPLTPEQPPAPLSPHVPLNPPMVGFASPFDRVDGENRDLILEAIRVWARENLRQWTEAWQSYLTSESARTAGWLNDWREATVDFVNAQTATPDVVNEINAAKLFGIPTDGSDGTAKIKESIAYAFEHGKNLYYPAGDYLTTETLIVPGSVNIRGDGPGQTRFRAADTLTTTVFAVTKGATGVPVSLAVGAQIGATTLDVVSSSGIGVGDFLILGDNTVPDSNYTRTSGEIVQVLEVVGNKLYLVNPVRGTYVDESDFIGYTTAASAAVRKISMVDGISISGMTLHGNPLTWGNSGGVLLSGVMNAKLTGLEIYNFGGSGVNLQDCLSVTIDTVNTHDLTDDPANGRYGYGVNIGGCSRDVSVMNVTGERVRHLVTTNGGNARGVPSEVAVKSCVGRSTTNSTFDTHGAGINITFTDCMSVDSLYGYSIRARNVTIMGCTAVDSKLDGVIFWASRNARVAGSWVRGAKRYGVSILKGVDITVESMGIDNVGSHGIRVAGDNGLVQGVKLHKNIIVGPGGITTAEGIFVVGAIEGLSVMFNSVDGKGGNVRTLLDAASAPDAFVSGNRAANIGYANNPMMKVAASARLSDNLTVDGSTWDGAIYMPTGSNQRFSDINSLLNRTKREGMAVFNGQIKKLLIAHGSQPDSPWGDSMGTVVITPA